MAVSDETKQAVISALDGSGLSESLIEAVLNRLDSFGYEVTESEAWAVGFAMQKAANTIRNECNVNDIPEGLTQVYVDMACGDFLYAKKQTGQLTLGDLDLSGAVTSIKEGDTQVSFDAAGSDSDKLDSFLNALMNGGKDELVCYRRIRW